MTVEKINIVPDYEKFGLTAPQSPAVLTCIYHDVQPERSFPAVVVIPGGSYSKCSKREGEPCAARFYSYGFNAFILEYSVVEKPFPTALIELCEAVRFIKSNSEKMHVTDSINIIGFSAGGHLAASLGAYHDHELVGDYRGTVRPDKLVLCYPVISSGMYSHEESIRNIAPDEKTAELVSLEKHINSSFPPAFIWHCADDRTVPVKNSLLLAGRLADKGIPFELHIFPEGGHALAMCDVTSVRDGDYDHYINPKTAHWTELALEWLDPLQTAAFKNGGIR